MYETPRLSRVGQAEKVILGVSPSGSDIDGNWVSDDAEFAGDGDLIQIIATTFPILPL